MRMSIWALVTCPPNLPAIFDGDDDVAKVSVLVMVPLPLQYWAEEADVRPLLSQAVVT